MLQKVLYPPSLYPSRKETMKKKSPKTDGLGPLEISKIRSALRLVWQRSFARSLVVKRCTGKDGYTYCEKCRERCPKLKVDHIERCGDVLEPGYVLRLMVPSQKLQGLCKECHDLKTKLENSQQKWGF